MRYNANDYITPVVLAYLVILMAIGARCSELPNAPHMAMHQPLETYEPDQRMLVHNTPSHQAGRERIVDWSFLMGHGVYAGSLAFDSYETAKNVGTCAMEGNPDLGTDPGNKRLVIHGLVEFGAVVAGDALIKWAVQRNNVPRWFVRPLGVMAAGIGTGKHIRGGMQWVRLCH